MKRELVIVGECVLLIIIMLIIKIVLGNFIPKIVKNDIMSFVFYFISGMGSVLIYRKNTKSE